MQISYGCREQPGEGKKMKKIIVLTFIMIMTSSMVACGNTGGDSRLSRIITTFSKPTVEEMEEMSEYRGILSTLDEYCNTGWITYWDEDDNEEYAGTIAFEHMYEDIQELKSVDRWIGTNRFEETRERESILNAFYIVEDLKLYENVVWYDRTSTVRDEWVNKEYRYAKDGKLEKIIGEQSSDWGEVVFVPFELNYACSTYWSYDADGILKSWEFVDEYSEDNNGLKYKVDFVSDKEGKIISANMKESKGEAEIIYQYDENGRIDKVECKRMTKEGNSIAEYSYVYNEQGKIEQEIYELLWCPAGYTEWNKLTSQTVDYEYDEKGHAVSGTIKLDTGAYYVEDECVFECDEQGRIIRANITFGDKAYAEGVKPSDDSYYTDKEITYTYGDYYWYMPERHLMSE